MGQIDLSKYSPVVPEMGRERQVFAGEGKANVYKALAGLGGTLEQTAIDLHNKEMDIRTDREANDALNKYKFSVAEESNKAILDRDPNTGLVKSSGKSFDEHMSDFMTEQKKYLEESLVEPISKVKFSPTASSWTTDQNVANLFKNVELQKEDSNRNLNKQVSTLSDKIRTSSTMAILNNYNTSLQDLDENMKVYSKVNGIHAAAIAQDGGTKKLLETAIDATIREAATDTSATVPFGQLLGIGTMFKNGKDYSSYVMQNWSDISDDVLSKADEDRLKVSLEKDYNDYLSTDAHPTANLLTPEEKDKYLKKFLANSFANKKEDQKAIKSRLNNWLATPQLQSFSLNDKEKMQVHLQEFNTLMSQTDMQPPEKMEYISKAINSFAEGMIRRDRVAGDKYALTASAAKRQKLVANYSQALINASGLNQSEVEQARKLYPSTVGASKNTAAFEGMWKKQEEKFNSDIATPNGVWNSVNKDVNYNDALGKAFKVGADGVIVDPKQLSTAWGLANRHFNRYGTAASQFASDSLFANPVMDSVMKKLEISSPEYKRQFMENINSVSPVLQSAFVNQLAKKGESLSDLNHYRSMKFDDPQATKRVNDNILFVNQKFGKAEIKDWIADRTHQGFLLGDVKADAIVKDINNAVDKSKYITDMKEIAAATGFPESEIKVMMDSKTLTKGTLMEMEDNPDTSRFTFHTTKVQNALDKVVKNVYNNLTPINSNNIKAVANISNPDDLNIVNTKASSLAKMIDEGLRNGSIKYDTQSLSKVDLSKLTPQQRDWYERDTKNGSKFNANNIALVGKTMDGRIGEMTLMYKEQSSGKYRMLKLIDSQGKSFTPSIQSVDDLKTNDVNILFNKHIKR